MQRFFFVGLASAIRGVAGTPASVHWLQNHATFSKNADVTNYPREDKFLYFAYGSNLLTNRIHINNPTAVRNTSAKLKDYRLDFAHWSNRWRGAAATIVPDPGEDVWGAVWQMDFEDMAHLDRQEGVHKNVYFPLEVTVESPSGDVLSCRCYQLCETPSKLPDGEPRPADRLPSALYLNVIVEGAKETGLPDTYIKKLEKIPHNNYTGDGTSELDTLVPNKK